MLVVRIEWTALTTHGRAEEEEEERGEGMYLIIIDKILKIITKHTARYGLQTVGVKWVG